MSLRAVFASCALLVTAIAAIGCAEGQDETIRSSGPVMIERGEYYGGDFSIEGSGEIVVSAVDQGARVSPLKPHDELRVEATIDAGGRTYEIRADTPLVGDPAGRHTTWWGVGYHVSHHGESGIGTDKLPAIDSEMAVFGLAEVRVDGDTVARGVPIHVMTADDGLPGELELDVGDPDMGAVPALPDGHLRVVWESYEGDVSSAPEYWRWLGGGAVLVVMLGGLLALSRRHLSRLSD